MSFWNTLPYHKRNAYLLIGSFLFALLVWKLAIGATYTLYQQNSELEVKLQRAENAPAAIQSMQARSLQWEQMALAYTATQHEVQKLLLASVSEACANNKVRLQELSHAGGADEAGARIETFKVQLEGGFHGLIRAIDQLEKELLGGRIVSAQLQNIEDRRNKRTYLEATLYIQSIMKEAYEKE